MEIDNAPRSLLRRASSSLGTLTDRVRHAIAPASYAWMGLVGNIALDSSCEYRSTDVTIKVRRNASSKVFDAYPAPKPRRPWLPVSESAEWRHITFGMAAHLRQIFLLCTNARSLLYSLVSSRIHNKHAFLHPRGRLSGLRRRRSDPRQLHPRHLRAPRCRIR